MFVGWVYLVDNDATEQQPAPAAQLIIADSSPLFRSALRQLLREETDLEVLAEAAGGREAARLCCQLQPDLLVMGFLMSDVSGIEALRDIKHNSPSTMVLVLTELDHPHLLAEALRAGASGYVLKSASAQNITNAIRRALRGESPLNQEVAMQLLHKLLKEEKATNFAEEHRRASLPEGGLTQREAEVLRLVVRGHTNQEIAQSLFLSVSTVKKHVHNLIKKLGVSDRTQLAVKAIELGQVNEQHIE